jgi:hypothetical protein
VAGPDNIVLRRPVLVLGVVVSGRVGLVLLILVLKCGAVLSHAAVHEIEALGVEMAGLFLFIFNVLENGPTAVVHAESLLVFVLGGVLLLLLGPAHELVVGHDLVELHAVVGLELLGEVVVLVGGGGNVLDFDGVLNLIDQNKPS